jgi:predicted DNA-binding transcriptional regulator AlpA
MAIEPLISEKELALLTGRSVDTIQKDRLRGFGPPYFKIGRLVRYRPSAVQAWLDAQSRRSTTDPGDGGGP